MIRTDSNKVKATANKMGASSAPRMIKTDKNVHPRKMDGGFAKSKGSVKITGC